MKLRVQDADYRNTIEFLLVDGAGGEVSRGVSVTMEPWDEMTPATPTFSIPFKEGQVLMDSLWSIGIRPSRDENGSHLQDMRRIAFKFLDMGEPK